MIVLTRYGLREWLAITVVLVPACAVCVWWAFTWHRGWWIGAAVAMILWFAGLMFFRDPLGRRPATDDPRDLVSPADGRVSAVLRLDHHDAVGGPALLVRIFLSVLDVHLNRAPCDGTVERIDHKPGRHLDARTEESAKVNESLLMVLRLEDGRSIGVRQVSGAIARRIVCAASPGERLVRGQRYGMIKFGSTTELIVPAPGEGGARTGGGPGVANGAGGGGVGAPRCLVSVGDRVIGGVTILARLA